MTWAILPGLAVVGVLSVSACGSSGSSTKNGGSMSWVDETGASVQAAPNTGYLAASVVGWGTRRPEL